ncbi:MAG: RNA methyltransferase [Bdellovibrionota bacterium]
MKRKAPLAVALMHYPTKDRVGDLVATNITNFDIHDIARACRVYGIDRYYLVHPIREQLMFVERVLDHWNVGEGSKFNPMRKTALRDVRTAENLPQAMSDWGHKDAKIIVTSAKTLDNQQAYSFKSFKSALETEDQAYFLVFGTGFGLTQDFMRSCHGVLESIKGNSADDYRHLSVRSAVSICLDRLLGS